MFGLEMEVLPFGVGLYGGNGGGSMAILSMRRNSTYGPGKKPVTPAVVFLPSIHALGA